MSAPSFATPPVHLNARLEGLLRQDALDGYPLREMLASDMSAAVLRSVLQRWLTQLASSRQELRAASGHNAMQALCRLEDTMEALQNVLSWLAECGGPEVPCTAAQALCV